MSLPVLLTSDMMGAPQLTIANGAINGILNACLVNGFNTQSVSSATASGGVVTFNFASAPGFKTSDTVAIAGASNSTVNGQFRVQSAASNQVLVEIPGVPDGAVGGTITLKFAPLGWTRPYSGTQLGAYRQGGGESFNRFLRVRDNTVTTANNWRYRGYENMTAISTGTGPFPTTAQAAGDGVDLYSAYPSGGTASGDPRPWVLVGTPRAFFFCYGSFYDNGGVPANGLLPPADTFLGSGASLMFFGDLANKTKPGDMYHTGATTQNQYPLGTQTSLVLARAASGVSGAIIANTISATSNGGASISYGATYPSTANGGVTLVGPPLVAENNTDYPLRGFLPGMLSPFESPAQNGVLKIGTVLQNVTGVTGRILLLSAGAVQSNQDCFILLDEDWGDV